MKTTRERERERYLLDFGPVLITVEMAYMCATVRLCVAAITRKTLEFDPCYKLLPVVLPFSIQSHEL